METPRSGEALRVLHERIAVRTCAIEQENTGWPCRKGCDHCCRHLAAVPNVTDPEWELLLIGFRGLPEPVRWEVRQRVAQLRGSRSPVTCPFLDREERSCLVYEHRPTACRTYGYFVERDGGLYCGTIEARVNGGESELVLWGNQAAIEQDLRKLGEARDLTDWFADCEK